MPPLAQTQYGTYRDQIYMRKAIHVSFSENIIICILFYIKFRIFANVLPNFAHLRNRLILKPTEDMIRRVRMIRIDYWKEINYNERTDNEIFDLRKGLSQENERIAANSPKEALQISFQRSKNNDHRPTERNHKTDQQTQDQASTPSRRILRLRQTQTIEPFESSRACTRRQRGRSRVSLTTNGKRLYDGQIIAHVNTAEEYEFVMINIYDTPSTAEEEAMQTDILIWARKNPDQTPQ